MRRPSSLTVLASAFLLMAAACDGLRLPALPARAAKVDTMPAAPAPKGRRAAKRSVKAEPALEAQRFDQIRRGLRRLVVAQETFYAEIGVYTEDLARIGFQPDGETELRFLWVLRGGWAASGTHPGVPGKDCVIYVGREHAAPTTLREVRSGREGVPVCDATPVVRPPSGPPAAPGHTGPAPLAPAPPDTSSALDKVEPSVQMRVDLRNLIRSQETYLGLQGVYSRRHEPFALQYLWHRGVTITILSANEAAWSARATHVSRPGRSCVIWFGPVRQRPATEARKLVPDRAGTPVCDG